MGYSPKHAKPVSLRSTALKTQHTPLRSAATTAGHGRHRAGSDVPVPRVPAAGAPETPVPADLAGAPVATGVSEAPVPASSPEIPGAFRAPEAAAPAKGESAGSGESASSGEAPEGDAARASDRVSERAPDRASERASDRAEAVLKLVPLQRVPLPES